ncbi:hypothetical protein WJX79_003753 [Trebouxia sp. C0005]
MMCDKIKDKRKSKDKKEHAIGAVMMCCVGPVEARTQQECTQQGVSCPEIREEFSCTKTSATAYFVLEH